MMVIGFTQMSCMTIQNLLNYQFSTYPSLCSDFFGPLTCTTNIWFSESVGHSHLFYLSAFIGNEPWCCNGINEKEIECCDWKMVSSFENKHVCFAWILVFAICWRSLFSHNIQYQLHYGVKSHFLFQQLIKNCAYLKQGQAYKNQEPMKLTESEFWPQL